MRGPFLMLPLKGITCHRQLGPTSGSMFDKPHQKALKPLLAEARSLNGSKQTGEHLKSFLGTFRCAESQIAKPESAHKALRLCK